jgi:hypothetical protein
MGLASALLYKYSNVASSRDDQKMAEAEAKAKQKPARPETKPFQFNAISSPGRRFRPRYCLYTRRTSDTPFPPNPLLCKYQQKAPSSAPTQRNALHSKSEI